MVMDLAQQYDQTLQDTIGQSQRERNKALRQAQEQGTSQLSNVPGASSWSDRGTSGFRGAGFQEVANSNVPQAQIQATKDTFGPSTAGGYVEGGKNLEGFYGEVNPYSTEGSNQLFSKAGFSNLGQASSMDLTYANLIPELSNNLMKYEGVGNAGNLYGRNGADPRNIAVQQGPTLQDSLSSRYNSLVNPTPTKLWKDYTNPLPDSVYDSSLPRYMPQNNGGDNLFIGNTRTLNAEKLAAAGFRTKNDPYAGINAWMFGGDYVSTPQYEQQYDGFNFDGNNYNSMAEAQGAKAVKLEQLLGTTKAQQSEFLSQLLTQGGITGRNLGERGSFGGNNQNDVISGDLQKLFGSKDITYNGKNYGTILDMAGYEDPLQKQWSESNTNTERKWYGPTKTTTSWDQGGSNLYRSLNNSDWWSQNAKNLGGGQILLTPEQLASSPGFSSVDNYVRDSGSQTQKQGILQKIWERTSPTSLLLKQDFAKMQPIGAAVGNFFIPGLGSALNAIDSYSKGDSSGGQGWLKSAGMSYLGSSLNTAGAGEYLGSSSATGLGTAAGNAIVAGGMGGLGAALQGGNAKNVLSGIASGAAGVGLNNLTGDLGKTFSDFGMPVSAGKAVGDFITGAGNNLASNLFNKNTNQGILQSALSSGIGRSLGGLYNNINDIKDPKQRSMNINTSNSLAKMFQQRKK